MSSKRPALVIGMGELGTVFASGFLKLGNPVFPVLRGETVRDAIGNGRVELVVVAVGEDDLDGVLESRPAPADDLVLMQNELLPVAWERHGLTTPNVVVVWFEKKPGRAIHTVLPSVVCGPRAEQLARCLDAVGVSHRRVDPEGLLFELVKKNLYILVHNVCGLVVDVTVERLWAEHEALAEEVASEVLELQFARGGKRLDRTRLMTELRAAVAADPAHGCAGRTAAARLNRALAQATKYSLSLPRLMSIARELPGG